MINTILLACAVLPLVIAAVVAVWHYAVERAEDAEWRNVVDRRLGRIERRLRRLDWRKGNDWSDDDDTDDDGGHG